MFVDTGCAGDHSVERETDDGVVGVEEEVSGRCDVQGGTVGVGLGAGF